MSKTFLEEIEADEKAEIEADIAAEEELDGYGPEPDEPDEELDELFDEALAREARHERNHEDRLVRNVSGIPAAGAGRRGDSAALITDEMCRRADAVLTATLSVRAALEAVAPALIAEELRKWGDPAFDVVGTKTLRDRAQELDPK